MSTKLSGHQDFAGDDAPIPVSVLETFQIDPAWLQRLIRNKSRRLKSKLRSLGWDEQDAAQELTIHAWELSQRYAVQGMDAERLLVSAIHRKAISLKRRATSQRRRPAGDKHVVPLDENALGIKAVAHGQSPFTTPSALEESAEKLDQIQFLLPMPLRRVFRELRVHSVTELARRSGISRNTVYRNLRAIRQLLAQNGFSPKLK